MSADTGSVWADLKGMTRISARVCCRPLQLHCTLLKALTAKDHLMVHTGSVWADLKDITRVRAMVCCRLPAPATSVCTQVRPPEPEL